MSKPYPYEGECRLLRWGDSSTAGRTITLEIPPDTGDVHPFKGFPVGAKYGQRFLMRFDVILDDETTPTATDSVETPPRGKEKDPDRSEKAKAQYASKTRDEQIVVRAALLCKDRQFQEWLCPEPPFSEANAARVLRDLTGVESRTDYEWNAEARDKFLKLETEYLMAAGRMAEAR